MTKHLSPAQIHRICSAYTQLHRDMERAIRHDLCQRYDIPEDDPLTFDLMVLGEVSRRQMDGSETVFVTHHWGSYGETSGYNIPLRRVLEAYDALDFDES